MKAKPITTAEAARILDLTFASVYKLGRDKKIKRIGSGLYSEASVKEYRTNALKRKDKTTEIYNVLIRYAIEEGNPNVTYRELQKELGYSSTSLVHTHVKDLIEQGKVEKYRSHIYLIGLRDHIKKIVRENYEPITEAVS